MKYIIEIENEPFGRNDDPFFPHGMDELYRAKGFKSLVFDQDGLDKLMPYTEPYRQDIEDEVWDFSMKTDFAWISEVGDKPLGDYSYQEAKAKYDAWRAERDEVRVGDEVKQKTVLWTGVVVGFDEVGDLIIMDRSGKSCDGYKAKYFKKTGRHFDEVEELLKKMGEGK